MKTKLQLVLAEVTEEQAMRLWDLVSGHVEDCQANEVEPSAGLVGLRRRMDAAVEFQANTSFGKAVKETFAQVDTRITYLTADGTEWPISYSAGERITDTITAQRKNGSIETARRAP